MYRSYSKLLDELLGLFPCVAIIGARQCGKTTLLKQLTDEWKIFDLEKGSDQQLISQDPDLFFRLNADKTAIDECQILPEVFPALRVVIDANREQCGRFVITGSSSPTLLNAISESLAGRVAIIELSSFSLAEANALPESAVFTLIHEPFNATKWLNIKPRYELTQIFNYWHRGGYPEPWIRNSPRYSKLWMQNYLQTYVARDILQLFPGINRQKYHLFVQMLAGLSGTIINYSDVARALGVSVPTVRDYFQIAHGTFIWRQIPPYEKNATKRVVKHSKGYLRDSGLQHFLLHLNHVDDLLVHPQMGRSWEMMVIENILRGLDAGGVAYEYFHYRTGGGAEVDLILEGEFGLLPVEIKYNQKVSLKELRGIRDFIAERGCPYGVVINNGERVVQYDENLIGVPFACL
jgi:hypothetical protein